MTEIVVDWDVKHQNKQKHARFLKQNNIKCFFFYFFFSEMKGFLIFFCIIDALFRNHLNDMQFYMIICVRQKIFTK